MLGNIKSLNEILRAVANSAKAISKATSTLSTATVFTLTVPANATSVRITIEADDISKCHDAARLARYWTTGNTPTTSQGLPVAHLDDIFIEGKQSMGAFRLLEIDKTAGGTEVITLNIQYYQD